MLTAIRLLSLANRWMAKDAVEECPICVHSAIHLPVTDVF